jgi:hypothetical protein
MSGVDLKPGRMYVGQVIRHYHRTNVTVWFFVNKRRMSAYGDTVQKEFPVGTIVCCRVNPAGTFIDHIHKASKTTTWKYRKRELL